VGTSLQQIGLDAVTLPLQFDERVWCDIQEIHRYYQTRGAHLPRAFEIAVKAALDHIQTFPEACPPYVGTIRRYRLSRYKFPYYVGYSIEAAAITIICVIHTSRSEEVWENLP
jgi:plasmid stabilization system protein ParE